MQDLIDIQIAYNLYGKDTHLVQWAQKYHLEIDVMEKSDAEVTYHMQNLRKRAHGVCLVTSVKNAPWWRKWGEHVRNEYFNKASTSR